MVASPAGDERVNAEHMAVALPLSLVLIGVSGSGKSTVGLSLAPVLGAMFIEGDDYHPPANIAKMRAGVPLVDADRWLWLENLGRAIGDQSDHARPAVTACSALRYRYRAALSQAARRPLAFVHLAIEPRIVASRLGTRRPHFMPLSLLNSQLATWEPLRADEDGMEIHATGTAQHTIEAIQRWLRLRAEQGPDGRYEKGAASPPPG